VEPDVGLIPRFTSSEFDFDGSSGFDGFVGWDNGCGWGVDFRYLWVDDFTATESFFPLDDPQIATTPIQTPTLFDTGDLFLMDYTSDIQSVELLGHRDFGRFRVTAGFRYIELNESMGINIFENPGSLFADEYGFNAANDLYGFQVGIESQLWCRGKFHLDGVTKFGIYGNDISASSFLDDPGDPLLSRSGTDTATQTAFGLDLGLSAAYDVTCNLSVRAGYQLMYLDGVALAADQVPNTSNLIGLPGATPVTAHGGNSVLYHGLNVGFEYRF
jgi:opacity protein-like surface antigen